MLLASYREKSTRKMKYKFTTLLVLAFMAIANLSLAQGHAKKANVNTEKGIGADLPQFAFELPDGSTLTPSVLAEQPVIVFYFDPDCDHCNKQAKMVSENADQFEGITMIWVSWALSIEDNVNFYKKYFMEMPDKVYIARDIQFSIDQLFGYSEVPSVYVYNKEFKRTASFEAETDTELLVKFAKQP